MLSDIIAAISTPKGTGGIAVIRISGEGALSLASRVFFPKSKKNILDYPPRHAIFGDIADSSSSIDSGILTYFKAPASFTGEDMVEISCHGGYIVSSMVLKAVLDEGARMAEGGEFTRRAFINDKITLTSAEAIGNMLTAESEGAVRLSSKHISGALSEKLNAINTKLTALVSTLFASIDYPEEDLEDMGDDELVLKITEIIDDCRALEDTYRSGHAVAHGINTVIIGKPNVGKSSFFNTLLGDRKAIVTDIPGTTRDIISETVEIDGVALRIFDTAGIREKTEDTIEKIGVSMAREKLSSPDTELILALFDLSRELESEDEELLEILKSEKTTKTVVPIFTKADKSPVLDTSKIEDALGAGKRISSESGEGIEEIKKHITKEFITSPLALREGAVITSARQLSVMKKTRELLERSRELIDASMKDMALLELESALSVIGEIDKRSVSERIVNEIFSKFCVGK